MSRWRGALLDDHGRERVKRPLDEREPRRRGAATPHHAQWQWVRGHAGHPQNEYANDLAVQAAREQSSSDGARTSRFDEWLEAQRLRKRVMVEPAPFPVGRPFAPMRPLPRASTTSH